MIKFEIGRTYKCKSACNRECVWVYSVIDRTACTITIKDDCDKIIKCRINKGMSEYCGSESVYPLGRHSMAPVLSADKIA